MSVYAVVQAGGKQHKVSVGQTLLVEKMDDVDQGATVALEEVLLVGQDDMTSIGTPTLAGARVLAEVLDPDTRGKKLIVFKYKAKVRYRRKKGHRQHYTRLKVTEIVPGGESLPSAVVGAAGRIGKAVVEAATDSAGAVTETVVETARGAAETVVEKAKDALPRRGRSKAKATDQDQE